MHNAKTVIVEDNPHNYHRLKELVEKFCPELQVVEIAESVAKAKEVIEKNDPQIVFLDVELPDGSGFDILEYFRPVRFKVIFFTGHLIYAYQAIKFNAIDFLLKPVSIADLKAAVEKALSAKPDEDYQRRVEAAALQFSEPDKIVLHESSGFKVLEAKNIIQLQANGSYTIFYLTGNQQLSYCKILKEFEDLLQTHKDFMRVHRSHIINLSHVQSFSAQGVIRLTDGIIASLGDSYRERFLEYFS